MQHKNRGMFLESIINKTIILYRKNNFAIFHKKPIPINFKSLQKEGNQLKVTEGWVGGKSTTDYYGIYNGMFIAFEAKSVNGDSLPLSNIKEHQIRYIKEINDHGGFGFFIVGFKSYNEYFLITAPILENLNRKSLTITTAREKGQPIELVYPGILDFAELITKNT